jgi:hypothetical protein
LGRPGSTSQDRRARRLRDNGGLDGAKQTALSEKGEIIKVHRKAVGDFGGDF